MVFLDDIPLELDLLDFEFLLGDLVLVVFLVGLVVLIQSAVAFVVEILIVESLEFQFAEFLLEVMDLHFGVVPVDSFLEFGDGLLELAVLTVDAGHDLVVLVLLVGVGLRMDLVVGVLQFFQLIHLFGQSFLLGP